MPSIPVLLPAEVSQIWLCLQGCTGGIGVLQLGKSSSMIHYATHADAFDHCHDVVHLL